MKPYPSIPSLRPRGRGQIRETECCSEVVESMSGLRWTGYEKLDGTGVRIMRNESGELVIRGRKGKSQLPPSLVRWFEDCGHRFGSLPAGWCLYGEGIGPGIQKVGDLYADVRVVAFDLQTQTGLWLTREELHVWAIGKVECAPLRFIGTTAQCEEYVRKGKGPSLAGKDKGEGLICRPLYEPLDNHGERIIVKIKGRDYE